jgi:hypothetical protein
MSTSGKLVGGTVKPRLLDLSPVADCKLRSGGSFDNDLTSLPGSSSGFPVAQVVAGR